MFKIFFILSIITIISGAALRKKVHKEIKEEYDMPYLFHCAPNEIIPIYDFTLASNNSYDCHEERLKIYYSVEHDSVHKNITGYIGIDHGCIQKTQKTNENCRTIQR